MTNYLEEELDKRTEEEIKRDNIFGKIAIIISLLTFSTGIIFGIILKNSNFIDKIWPKGFFGRGFVLTIYFLISFILSIIITVYISKIYTAVRGKIYKFRESGKVYKASDYFEWKKNKRNRNIVIVSYIYFSLCITISILGPALISKFSNQGLVLFKPSIVGISILLLTFFFLLLTKKKFIGKKEKTTLIIDTTKSLFISIFIYLVSVLIFSYARLWTIQGYWVICSSLGFVGGILTINFVMLYSHKREKVHEKSV